MPTPTAVLKHIIEMKIFFVFSATQCVPPSPPPTPAFSLSYFPNHHCYDKIGIKVMYTTQ